MDGAMSAICASPIRSGARPSTTTASHGKITLCSPKAPNHEPRPPRNQTKAEDGGVVTAQASSDHAARATRTSATSVTTRKIRPPSR